MRLLSFFVLLVTSMIGTLHANDMGSNCHCTAENHCGCMDGKPCKCIGTDKPAYQQNQQSCAQVQQNVESSPQYQYSEPSYTPYQYDFSYSPCDEYYPVEYDSCCEEGRYRCPNFLYVDDTCDWPCCLTGAWMPQRPQLFKPLIADPRQITYSVGWRFNDQAFTKNVIDVSYFDIFPVYGWCNAFLCGDKLQIDLDGCLWAIFDPCTWSSPLMNADYYVGIHVNYAYKDWSARLRVFHISSHVGDEFLLNHPHFDRRNPSAEYLDFCLSYQWFNDLRLYGGIGSVLEQDSSFHTGWFYGECGFEARITSLGVWDTWNAIYRVPFVAAHFRYNKDFKRHLDSTYVIGYEFGKTNCLEPRLRFFLEYHDGYSVEGQWSTTPTNYLSLRASYGF